MIKVKGGDFTDDLKLTRAVGRGGLLMVKADWCGHCTRAIPQLEKVCKLLGKSFNVYIIDADSNDSFIKKAKIVGFPTIVYIDKNGKMGETFDDERKAEKILKFICKKSLVCVRN